MGLDVPVNAYGLKLLQAAYDEDYVLTLPANFTPNLSLVQGTVVGKVTNSANDVNTLTPSGTVTGGSVTIGLTTPFGAAKNVVINWNDSAATVSASVAAQVGAGNYTVSGGGLNAAALVFTAAGAFANMPLAPMTVVTMALTGTSPNATFAHTTTGATANTWNTYASGNSDGSQLARGVLPWQMSTDTAGNITYGSGAAGGEFGDTYRTMPVIIRGYFFTQDLTGLDANAVTNQLGKISDGTTSLGVIHIF